MELPIEAGKGVYLMGEAAQAYVQFLYYQMIIGWVMGSILLLLLIYCGFRMVEHITDND